MSVHMLGRYVRRMRSTAASLTIHSGSLSEASAVTASYLDDLASLWSEKGPYTPIGAVRGVKKRANEVALLGLV